ncbi:hypothetical protein [Pedobacter punctiformis]|uniref:Uncharacterized protein n=1 Tax=Pedobacter punctiformis TaxID=3004097 RepID=A0ABT4L4F0_9SPHI|nr:hypothetical protein [Pedobacter sp. HCMS5-2]MCZ4242582.1 hypothetical protein [Pedobacter sp. HCMS5-2]
MKTNIYNKTEHIEGYAGGNDKNVEKTDVQKAYEKGNDSNEVTSFGKDTVAVKNLKKRDNKNTARDGFDNTGTQGADSLSDDAYNSPDKHPDIESAASHTGSSSKDFKKPVRPSQRDEDDVLNTGI